MNCHSLYSQNAMVSFEYFDFSPKILLFRTHHLWNSTTKMTIFIHTMYLVCKYVLGEQWLIFEWVGWVPYPQVNTLLSHIKPFQKFTGSPWWYIKITFIRLILAVYFQSNNIKRWQVQNVYQLQFIGLVHNLQMNCKIPRFLLLLPFHLLELITN